MKRNTFNSKNFVTFLEKDEHSNLSPIVIESEEDVTKEAFFTEAARRLFCWEFDEIEAPIGAHVVYNGELINVSHQYYSNRNYRKIFLWFNGEGVNCMVAIVYDHKNTSVFFKDNNEELHITELYGFKGKIYEKEFIFDKLATEIETCRDRRLNLIVHSFQKEENGSIKIIEKETPFIISRFENEEEKFECIDDSRGIIVYDGFIDTPFKRL